MKGFGIICAMILSCLTQVGFAATTYNQTVNGIQWTYTVSNGKASVGGGTSSSTAVPTSTTGVITIPSELGGYPVTSIGEDAFDGCRGLTSVTIPNSVTNIGKTAFNSCSGLTGVTIPDSVTRIEWGAFWHCFSLTSVRIPDSVAYIGPVAFCDCSELKNVTIPDNITYLDGGAFDGCNAALFNTTKIPGVKLVDDWVVGYTNFFGSRSINLKGVRGIAASAFRLCDGLKGVTIPDTVASIGSDAFYQCRGLTSVIMGNSVRSIGSWAFAETPNLNSIEIPDAVENIEEGAFFGRSPKTFVIGAGNLHYKVESGLLLSRNGEILVSVAANGLARRLIIPEGVTTIYGEAFCQCNGITSVTIPDSVNQIGSMAFYDCDNLTNVKIGNGVTRIENRTFYSSGLTSVIIPANVEYINVFAFDNCKDLKIAYLSEDYVGLTSGFPSSVNIIRYNPELIVTFDAQGGTVYPTNSLVTSGRPYGYLPEPSCEGYSFCGWKLGGTVIMSDTMVSEIWNHTLSAQWSPKKYTVIFDANGGLGGLNEVMDCGSEIIEPTVTREGYTFVGWDKEVLEKVPANDVTYTAQWEINQYAVTFDANGGEGSTSAKQDYGTAIVVPTVTRTGYTFMGWSPSVSATVPAHDVTYTAQWEINQYTVTFDANGGEGGTSVKQDYGSAIVAPTVTRMGYKFNGWSPEVEEIVPDHDVIFVAQWEEAFFHYSVVDGKATITGCALPIGVVTIPSIIGGYSVTEIASSAFSNCTNITQIIIPDSVKSIGDCAFYGCSGLTSMTIPNSVINIGAGAFSGCSGLSEISIPFVGSSRGNAGGADALFGYVFGTSSYAGGTSTKQYYSASSYSTFYIPSTLRRVVITGESSFGYGAFSYCAGLTNVTFGSSVVSVGAAAFRGCSGLTSVTIPSSVANIGNQAFDGCSKIKKVHVDDVAAWCNIKFGNYYSNPLVYANKFYVDDVLVSELVIPNSVRSIGDFAFCKCSGLISVTIPDSVTQIGAYAFRNCTGLTQMNMPDSVTSIWNHAFYNCTKLKFVELGNSITSIGEDAFENCSKLESVTIPNSVTSIGDLAFSGCSGLTNITIGSSITSIGGSVFRGCSGLTSVTIPDSVTRIGPSAFYGCSGLTSVTIPDGVTSIGSSAFGGCSRLTSVTIPGSVTSIESSAFSGTAFFEGLQDGLIIFGSVLYAMKGACPSVVDIPDGVSSISGRAFYNCSGLVSVTIPNSVVSIGHSAFYNCSGLTSVVFDGDAPTVGSSAFYNVASDCCIYVRRASSGWGVEIPGKWNGIAIDYVHHAVRFDANGGMCDAAELSVADGAEIGELPVPTKDGAEFYGWFTDRAGGERAAASTVILGAATLYARWLTEVDAPVVSASGGSVFRLDSCEVTISCATEGATIYYTDDGSTPKRNDDYLYTGPITITDTTTFKAIAVYGSLKSDYVTATITKQGLTIEETLDAGGGVVIATDAAIPWKPFLDSTAKVGDATVRSGAIGDRASTWLSATVEGAGAMTFWCKTSCEHDEDNMFTWDRLMIYTNDVEIAEWRMDGETDWTERTLAFGGGTNTVKWVYYKDRTGAGGEDCAWVDAVAWSPAGAADPIPAVAVDADAATVNATVDEVGFADAAVKEVIGGSAEEYNAFKTWADGVKGATGDALAGEAAVVANGHAAAAYLLGSERLFVNEPTVEMGELAIVDGESAGTTTMTVAVTVKDGESAVAVSVANVAAMFEATGDLGDWNGAAKLTPTVTTSGTDASGKMTFVVTPGDGTAAKAFLRIRGLGK